MKVGESKVSRITEITLTNGEFQEAIVDYLKKKQIPDYDQHVVIMINDTREEKGVELNLTVSNYNKDYNLVKR